MKKLLFLFILLALCVQTNAQTSLNVTFRWTAPHDDWNDTTSGACDRYEMRMTTDTTQVWGSWVEIPGLPSPSAPGTSETFITLIQDLSSQTPYFFALRAYDESNNYSRSNIIYRTTVDRTAPSVITISW